jgi:tetratricopeptide (TPR) repeat protein
MTDAMTNHSDMESLAAFVDGRLEREERDAVTKHLETCEECQGFVREAAAFEQEEVAEAAAPKPLRTWWAVAAGVAVVVLAISPFVVQRRELNKHAQVVEKHTQELEKNTQELFEAIGNAGVRKIEARFSGQNAYAAFRVMRGGDKEKTLDEMIVESKAAELRLASMDKTTPADRRARALSEAFDGNPKDALAILMEVPKDARRAVIWNDIAAANYAMAGRDEHPERYLADALMAVDEALQRDPAMHEAMFNRVMILSALERRGEAAEALTRYLAADPGSQWAKEARTKIDRLTPLQ